mgnify:CR=1 FL=1
MAKRVKISENQLTRLTKGLVNLHEAELGGCPGGKGCCKYEWINNKWECTKWRKACCDEKNMEAPIFTDSKPMRIKENIQEAEEKKCCVCWKKVGVGGWADQDGPGWKWKCCGYKPCSELTMGFSIGKR